MAINLLGKSAVFNDENSDRDIEEGNKLNTPIHAFDIIITDESGQLYQPVSGVLFGKADMGLVLRACRSILIFNFSKEQSTHNRK